MSEKAEFAKVQFKVCEYGDGTPFLCTLENGPRTNTILNDTTSVTIQLKSGATFEDAEIVARYLNANIETIGIQFKVK
jgi:hypothetical protein